MVFLIQEFFLVENRFYRSNNVHAAIFFNQVFVYEFAEQFNRTSLHERNWTATVVNSFQVCVLKFTFVLGVVCGRLMSLLNDVAVNMIDREVSVFLDVRIGISRRKTWTNDEAN